MARLQLTVNGREYELEVQDSRTLAEVLRYDLGLTGTKIGCNEAECGICTVLVNGVPVDSCIYPALKAAGTQVLTIEGLARRRTGNGRPPGPEGSIGNIHRFRPESLADLHPLQAEFVRHGAVQCGFCIPGLIMTAAALLEENPNPGEHDIVVALKDTFCRCAGYPSIIQAIQSAAAILRGEAPWPVAVPTSDRPLHVVGRLVNRPEAMAKVTGAAIYSDDIEFPGQLYGRTLRAAYPHARILSIDTSQAEALAGVRAVLTARNVHGRLNHGLVYHDWPALAGDKVRYLGDPVAIVAAETSETATEALQLIRVEYELLEVVNSPEYALEPAAPILHEEWPTGNLLKHIKVRHGDVAQGFAEADVIVERVYHTAITEHAFLEPECAIGVPAGYDEAHPRLTVYVGSQIPYADRNQVAACLGLPDTAVRIISPLVGGGFGGKEDIAAQVHVALLAQRTGRPVKMLYSRQESLLFHPKRHATTIRMKTGATRDGRLTAVEAELYGDGGAYASLSDKVMTRATTHATGPYVTPHAKIDCYATYTNNPPAGAFRGFGVTQSAFAVEQNMDILAEELGLDPIEFRRRNGLYVGATTATGQQLRESVGLARTLDVVEERLEIRELEIGDGRLTSNLQSPISRYSWREGHKAYAWGIACGYKNTGLGGGAPDRSAAAVEVYADGTAEVRSSAAEIGQGLVTVVVQITAEELGLPYEQVKVLLSDTELAPDGGPTTASRQTYVTGNAARMAAGAMRDALSSVVAERFDVPPGSIRFEEGLLRANGQVVEFGRAVQWLAEEGRPTRAVYEYTAPQTQPLGTGGDMHVAFSFATQAALVEVDLETGEVRVLKVIAANDVGRAINPVGLQGQVEGGVMMGLGNALTEEYIVEKGVPFTDVLARYKMPGIKHMPEIVSLIVEEPTAEGPYGAKGVGEISSIPTTPAICNAIYNACGVRVYRLPVDQDALLRALKGVGV
ncbi:MAG: molybdopterin-dependent oxidoreductase [Chloroflexi bacterium]|nr:molybdopterin-dependent oxidoreductase [Chloroflexota bacterium]MCI0581171.1 molybdopterin-dependent oxidoreductase [Chloroflexota bacterium]MCI0643460.1 molybdopterin-dependent oxidoreductase [Chloroflexota bacterium]MCI0727458.1 molybdopterin-dependent oxidoreductase [Chloroflexota bacterium]